MQGPDGKESGGRDQGLKLTSHSSLLTGTIHTVLCRTTLTLDPASNAFNRKVLGSLSILILLGILVAGLWPFHAPVNHVTWLRNSDGVALAPYATIVSSKAFESSGKETFCSLEIALQPRFADDSSTILAFFAPEHVTRFSLEQYQADLVLEKTSQDPLEAANGARTGVNIHDVFLGRRLRLISVASEPAGTSVYVDGVLAAAIPQFRLSTHDCSGQLVLGTSPVVNKNWSGQLRELAIYNEELTAAQVSRHFEAWTAGARLDGHPLAFYRFDEHRGHVAHDSSGSGRDLSIPDRYLILNEQFLETPRGEFHNDWDYWKNIAINIGGFIPLGFFFYAYLTVSKRINLPGLTVVSLGAAISLTIEALQAYLPTRDSGLTDIITNTLGAGLGVMLCRWTIPLMSDLLSRVRVAARGMEPASR